MGIFYNDEDKIMKVILIGAGVWGSNILRTLKELNHDVVVVDPIIPEAPSLDSVLSSDIKAAFIATPVPTHAKIADQCLEAGKHVFVEKPLATCSADAKALSIKALKKGLVLATGHLMLFHPVTEAAADLITDDTIGTIKYAEFNRLGHGTFRKDEDVMWSMMPHDFAMMSLMIGTPEYITAIGCKSVADKYDVVEVTADHADSKTVIRASWIHPIKNRTFTIVGTHGTIVGDPDNNKLTLYPHSDEAISGKVPPKHLQLGENIPVSSDQPLTKEIEHFFGLIDLANRTIYAGSAWYGPNVVDMLECATESLNNDGLKISTAQSNDMSMGGLPHIHKPIQHKLIRAAASVVESGRYINGPKVKEFEERIAGYLGVKHCIGVSNGTDALIVSLMALGIGTGDEVITTAYSFYATAEAIQRVGATPVFVDIDNTFNINAALIETKITDKTKAILPVHLFGKCADMKTIMGISHKYNIPVIEDAAQAFGAQQDGTYTGCFGAFGCTSFFPSKNLGGFGDGGAVFTNNDEMAEKVRLIRTHGSKSKTEFVCVGGNFRLDELQAALLLEKIEYVPLWLEDRRRVAIKYTDSFSSLVEAPEITSDHTFNQYVIKSDKANAIRKALTGNNIPMAHYYPYTLEEVVYGTAHCQVASSMKDSTIALPIHPHMLEVFQNRVIETLVGGVLEI